MDEFLKLWPVIIWILPLVAAGTYAWATIKHEVGLNKELALLRNEVLESRVVKIELREDRMIDELRGIREEVIKLRSTIAAEKEARA